ncbi:MAG: hypothetical protein AAGI15_17520 [Pseudomonadota bacterium]
MKELLCRLILSCTVAGPGAKPVDELVYGTVLYDYFQESYSDALVTTMIAEAREQRGEDLVRFELAKGSFAFKEQLYDLAAETFGALDPAELTDLDNQRLAFHLAREYHRREDWDALAQRLAQIDLGENWRGRLKTHPEVEYMRADLALAQGRFEDARAAIDLIEPDHPLRAYALFNLGVVLKDQSPVGAAEAFTTLAALEPRSAESLDLVQRAKLALAFLASEREAQTEAATVLAQLPAQGRYRDTALAAYGALAMDQGEYELAARIWLTLKDEPYWTPSTAAARLGFPLSLENLASQELALAQYRRAEQTFEARLTALDTLSNRAQDPGWVRELLYTFSTPGVDEADRSALMERWQEELGHTDWLEWLASETVHGLLLDWRALLDEKVWLDGVPENLAALEQVATEQRRRSQQARALLHEEELLLQRDVLQVQLGELDVRLDTLRGVEPDLQWAWMHEIGTPAERELLEQLKTMSEQIGRYFEPADQARWQARIDRLRGVLLWDQTVEQATRLQSLRRTVSDTAAVLADVDTRIARVQAAERQFVAGVETNFTELAERAGTVREQVAQAIGEREERLALELQRGMQQERAQVRQYLLVTRVAIARTADQLAGVGPDAGASTGADVVVEGGGE